MQKPIIRACSRALREYVDTNVIERHPITLRHPPDITLGDYAIPIFPYAKTAGIDPGILAQQVATTLASLHPRMFTKAESSGGFVNLTLDSSLLFAAATNQQIRHPVEEPANIMVEFLSPNTNKPLHLGHIRNGVLGTSLSSILNGVGHRVVRANLVNDRGIHICKSMLAWMKYANGSTPESTGIKGDHFVGEYYVTFDKAYKEQVEELVAHGRSKAEAEATAPILLEAQELLRKWEAGDPNVVELWRTMTNWVLEGFDITNRHLGWSFDHFYYESETYTLGRNIVQSGLQRGVFRKDTDGAVVFDLSPDVFGANKDDTAKVACVLRADGTSVYLTQDVGTAVVKAEGFDLDRSIYVVGSEQRDHFAVLFTILKALGYPWASQCFHLSYEMVDLPEGKMKSREGTVVDADDLVDEMTARAATLMEERGKMDMEDKAVMKRAENIGLAAIKFYMLIRKRNTRIQFDPKASISLEGDTGPYCLYALVRARKLLARGEERQRDTATHETSGTLGTDEERTLARELVDMPTAVYKAAENYDPSVLASYVLGLAKAFNQFYTQCPIFENNNSRCVEERLELVRATESALAYTLSLLGITAVDEM